MPKVNYRSQFSYSFAGQPVIISAKVSIGAAGAPTLASGTGMGISSITRNSAGDYSILLDQAFAALMNAQVMIDSGASAPAAPLVNIEGNTVSTASAPTLRLQCRNLSGTATDPASGEILYVSIMVNRSSTGY